MADLSLALLGPPAVERDGSPVVFDTRKAIALLALLAVSGRPQDRERLAALLWPDSDSTRARGSLRRTLSVTAAAMGEGLAITRSAVMLRPERVRVDLTEFQALAARPDVASLEQAVRLYRDDFLAGFSLRGCDSFADWQAGTADRLRQSLAGTLERLVSVCIAGEAPGRALGHAQRWLALDPLHEPAHQALIRLLAGTGQRSAAVRQYRALVRVLDRELAVRPLPETTRLYDDVRAGRLGPAGGSAPADRSRQGGGPAAHRLTVAGSGAGHAGHPAGPGTWPLTGREAELSALGAAWRATSSAGRSGQVVVVTGEAGCGKTRLADEFRLSVEQAGGTVLSARCHDGESGLPFAVAVDLLRHAASVCPDLADRMPAHAAAMAARLLPELAGAHTGEPPPSLSSPVALTRLYAAAGTALLLSAQPTGRAAVVVIDDVHWADGPSLDLLAYLIRRPASWPLLLVLTWRPEQAERLHGLQSAVTEAADAGRGHVLEPGPLAEGEVSQLLRAAGVDGADITRLMAETHGLPLLVREYAEALRAAPAGGEGHREGQGWEPPEPVRILLSRRLQTASERAKQMLSAAAVLGGGCDADLLREVSGRGEAETVEALDEAVRRFLLAELPPGGEHGAPRYDFPYEPLRRVAYESASLARRRLLHARAAKALTARYERDPISVRAAVVAGHLQRAGREGEAARWWWRAADQARELYAHAEAHAHLRQALALGYPQVEGAIALGDVLTALGRYREALAEYETAAAASEANGATSAAIEHKLAEVHHRLGDYELADAHLAAAGELLPGSERGRRARVAADRAVIAYRRGATAQAARLGRDALATAQRGGDQVAVAQALNVLGMLAARDGQRGAAEQHLRDSLAHARTLHDPGAAVAALNNLARLLAESGRPAEALPLAEEALALGSELGDQHRVAALHTNLADVLHAVGRREAALRHLKEAARRFAAVDAGSGPRPEIWTLVEW